MVEFGFGHRGPFTWPLDGLVGRWWWWLFKTPFGVYHFVAAREGLGHNLGCTTTYEKSP
jgi:hypothetical protein